MWRFGCGVVLCGAIVGGLASPAVADDAQAGDPGSVLVGGFSVGDGLEAMIDEREGALRFQAPIGGLSASWDSRRTGADRSGLGPGWDWTIGSVVTEGGIRVFPASGGVYEADASVTSGLRGYEVGDVKFEQRDGTLPARAGVVEARPYSYVLTELGGVTTFFSASGDALAQSGPTGQRTDWLWSSAAAHRLIAVVDARGVRTDLVWDDAASSLVVRPAVNAGGAAAHEWRVQLADEGVSSVTDPLGQTTSYGYAEAGLVTSISGASGAATSVAWHQADDGITRVDELTTTDPAGAVLSSRTWQMSGTTAPTGWPATAQPGGAEFETVLADGASRVVSSYSAAGLLAHRELHVSTPSGDEIVQTVEYSYPDTKGVDPAELPGNWSRPSATEITHLDASGATRSIAESTVFDESGRVVERTAADGSVTRTEYDPTPVGDAGVPSGLVLREVVETPDGLVRERVNQPNEAHTAVVGTELREARLGGEGAVVERTEFEVGDDGFIREQRVFPQGGASAAPVVTRWSEQVALAEGTVTRSETVAAGTAAEATTSQVASLVHGAALEEIDALGNRTAADYDELGRPTRRVDTTRNAIGAEPVTTATEYRYDGFSRLIGSTVRAGERADAPITRETGYELSLAGDIAAETVRTDPGGETEATTTRRFDYSARGELQTITTENADGVRVAAQTYDTSGNLQQAADGGSYVFDAANRPVRHLAADGTTTDTEYWADGSRKLQRSGGETTTFHWDGETLVNETVETDGPDGAGTSSYLIGAARHARTVQPEAAEPFTSYYGADRHGNVTDLTDRDGVVTTRYAYTDYGTTTRIPVGSERAERGIARDPFRYAGEHTDRSGTQHLATRSYDDGTMRFLSIDTEAFENRFAFADLNPIMHVDPTGGASERDTTNWLVAVVGALAVVASIASAVYTAGLSLHGLTFLSVTAAVAEATAVSVATAGVIDSFHDFMDDDTANKLMIAEIALPVGLALAGFVAKQIHGVVKATRSFGRHPGSKNVDLFARENWTPFGFKLSSPAGAYTSKGQEKFTELRQLMSDFNLATDPKTRQTLYNRLDRSDLYKHLRKDHNLDDPQRDRVYKEFTRGANQPSGEYDALFEQTRREMQHHLNTTRLTGVPRLDRGKNAFLDTRNLGSAEGDVRRVPGGRYFKD
jgi:RHS repeat-associated protein